MPGDIAHGTDEYRDTFIVVAPDCPTDTPVIPEPYRGQTTVAQIQYDLVAPEPYRWRHSDVLLITHLRHKGIEVAAQGDAYDAQRAAFFATPRACLRSSPLPKRFGWGVHFDGEGRAAFYGVGTEGYARLAAGGTGGPTVVAAMRSKRG